MGVHCALFASMNGLFAQGFMNYVAFLLVLLNSIVCYGFVSDARFQGKCFVIKKRKKYVSISPPPPPAPVINGGKLLLHHRKMTQCTNVLTKRRTFLSRRSGRKYAKKTPFERRFLWSERFLFWTKSKYLFFKVKVRQKTGSAKMIYALPFAQKENYSMSLDRPDIYVKLMFPPPFSKVSIFSLFPLQT